MLVLTGDVFDADPVSLKAAPPESLKSGDPNNVDDWGNLSLGAVRTGEVDELILNYCKNACASTWLDALILGAIVVNTGLLAMAGPATTLSEEAIDQMVVADLVLTIIFTAEMMIRIVALGFYDRRGTAPAPMYLNNPWNKMDFFVVITSWLNIIVEATGARISRFFFTLLFVTLCSVQLELTSVRNVQACNSAST